MHNPPARTDVGATQRVSQLREFFCGNQFALCDFQRDYEWDAESAVEFISCLLDAAERGAGYPLPSVCVYRDGDRYALVDGQQRFVTLSLAAAATARICPAEAARMTTLLTQQMPMADQPVARLTFPHTSGADATFAAICDPTVTLDTSKKALRAAGATSAAMITNTVALSAMLRDRFGADPDPKRVRDAWLSLVDVVTIAVIEQPTRRAAIEYFERVNSNVRLLSQASLVKNLVIGTAEGIGHTSTTAGRNWQRFADLAGSLGGRGGNGCDAVLYDIICGRWAKAGAQPTENTMFRWIADRVGCTGLGNDPAAFAGQLADDAGVLAAAVRGQRPDASPSGALRVLATYAGPTARLPRPILVAASHLTADAYDQVAWRTCGFAIVNAESRFRGQTQRDTRQGIADALRALPADATVDAVDAIFDAAVAAAAASATGDLAGRLASAKPGKAKALLAVAATTFSPPDARDQVLDAALGAKVDIEHVWPASTDTWAAEVDSTSTSTSADRDEIRYTLGNLTLLHAGRNRAAKDAAYADKRNAYGHDPLMMTRLLGELDTAGLTGAEAALVDEARRSDPDGTFDTVRIRRRGDDLARRILTACGLEVGDASETVADADPHQLALAV